MIKVATTQKSLGSPSAIPIPKPIDDAIPSAVAFMIVFGKDIGSFRFCTGAGFKIFDDFLREETNLCNATPNIARRAPNRAKIHL
jgi:hypothetical protein